MEITEERKQELRRMRAGTHWFSKFDPDTHKSEPEYKWCIEHGQHFDTLIGFIEQGGGMLTTNITAEQQEQEREATRTKGGPSADYLFDQWFKPWSNGKSPDTADNVINGWNRHFRGTPVNTKPGGLVEDHEFQSLILSLPMKAGGMRKWRGIWRQAVIKPLIRKGLRAYDPFEDMILPKEKTEEDEYAGYSMEQFQILRSHAESVLQAAYLDIGMGAGPRPNEELMLKDEDFNLDADTITIRRGRHGAVKGGKPRPTPLLPLARRGYELIKNGPGFHEDGWLFYNRSTGKPFNKNWDCGLKKLCEKTGVPYLGRYGLRHGYCYALANGDFGEEWTRKEAAEMMRHSDMSTIDVYYRLKPGRIHEKAQRATVPEVLRPTVV